MEIFVYRNGANEVEENFSVADLPELLADKKNVVWVDLLGESDQQIAETRSVLLDVLSFIL